MSNSLATERVAWRKAGCVVTSLTRSPSTKTRRPSLSERKYSLPVRMAFLPGFEALVVACQRQCCHSAKTDTRVAHALAKSQWRRFAAAPARRIEMRKVQLAAGVALLTLAAAVIATAAADYPSRPVTIMVGFPPSGASDILARIVGSQLATLL